MMVKLKERHDSNACETCTCVISLSMSRQTRRKLFILRLQSIQIIITEKNSHDFLFSRFEELCPLRHTSKWRKLWEKKTIAPKIKSCLHRGFRDSISGIQGLPQISMFIDIIRISTCEAASRIVSKVTVWLILGICRKLASLFSSLRSFYSFLRRLFNLRICFVFCDRQKVLFNFLEATKT